MRNYKSMFEREKNGNKTIVQTEWTWFLCELILYDFPTTKNIIKNPPLIFWRKTNNKSIILNAHFNDKTQQKKNYAHYLSAVTHSLTHCILCIEHKNKCIEWQWTRRERGGRRSISLWLIIVFTSSSMLLNEHGDLHWFNYVERKMTIISMVGTMYTFHSFFSI